jgi:beta-lactamase regulating signal transducer with metallopeptidase domain
MSDAIIAWFITYISHSTILIVGVWLVTRWLRSPVWCDLLWKLALIGGIATATLVTVLPSRIIDKAVSASGFVAQHRGETGTSVSREALAGGTPAEALPAASMLRMGSSEEGSAPQAGWPVSATAGGSFLSPIERLIPAIGPAVLALWSAGAVFLLLRLAAGHLRLMKRLRTRREVVTGHDFELMQRLRLHDPMAPVRLSTADALQSPITMLGSEIVLPQQTFERLTTPQKRSILAHELAHVRRLDPHWLCVAETICALLFLQPLNRLVRREMHLTAEFLCDDAALRQTGDRRALAETLAELAASIAPVRPMTVAAMAEGGSNLFRRVRRVLSGAKPDPMPIRLGARLALVTIPLVALSLLAPRIDAGMDVVEQSSVAEAKAEPARPPGGTITVRAEEPAEETFVAGESSVGGARNRSMTDVTGAGGEASEFNSFSHGVLDRSFDGPEGATSVEFRAHAAEVALDGTWVRLLEPDGFVRVTQVSSRGPKREVEVTAGENLRSTYVYRIDGERHAWCSDAERIIAASALGEGAYERRRPVSTRPLAKGEVAAGKRTEHLDRAVDPLLDDLLDRADARGGSAPTGTTGDRVNARKTAETSSWETHLVWRANVSQSEDTPSGRRAVRVEANGFHYNPNSGEIWIEAGGYVEVEERHAGIVRSFRRSAETIDWRGDQAGARHADREAWLVRLLTANSSVPPNVIRNLARG